MKNTSPVQTLVKSTLKTRRNKQTITNLKSTLAQQQKEIEAFAACGRGQQPRLQVGSLRTSRRVVI
jgi:hypothetical protein